MCHKSVKSVYTVLLNRGILSGFDADKMSSIFIAYFIGNDFNKTLTDLRKKELSSLSFVRISVFFRVNYEYYEPTVFHYRTV